MLSSDATIVRVDKRFELGKVVITRNALESLNKNDIAAGLLKHSIGNWGDLCAEDAARNEMALKNSERLFSVYHSQEEQKFYIITEWDRSVTTILLPEDY